MLRLSGRLAETASPSHLQGRTIEQNRPQGQAKVSPLMTPTPRLVPFQLFMATLPFHAAETIAIRDAAQTRRIKVKRYWLLSTGLLNESKRGDLSRARVAQNITLINENGLPRHCFVVVEGRQDPLVRPHIRNHLYMPGLLSPIRSPLSPFQATCAIPQSRHPQTRKHPFSNSWKILYYV